MIRNTETNKIYIGQTKQKTPRRWQRHLSYARTHSNLPLQRAIRKYGESAFELEELASSLTKSEANDLERVYVYLFNSRDSAFGYNLAAGGEGGGAPWSREAREKAKHRWTTGVRKAHSDNMRRRKIAWPDRRAQKNSSWKHNIATGQIVSFYESGLSSREIARRLGVCHHTVLYRLRAAGVQVRPPALFQKGNSRRSKSL